jgi:hypothetical protein
MFAVAMLTPVPIWCYWRAGVLMKRREVETTALS